MVPKLIDTVKKGESGLLREMAVAIEDKKIDAIILTIEKYLIIGKNAPNKFQLPNVKKQNRQNPISVSSTVQAIDSIKKGVNEMIDISKQAYSNTINKVQRLTFQLQKSLLKNMKLSYNNTLGYHYSVKSNEFEEKITPQDTKSLGIVIVSRLKHAVRFRTKVSGLDYRFRSY